MDVSGINTAATIAKSTAGVQREVATQIQAMSIDQMEQNGESLKKMMEMSVAPAIGGNFDVSV